MFRTLLLCGSNLGTWTSGEAPAFIGFTVQSEGASLKAANWLPEHARTGSDRGCSGFGVLAGSSNSPAEPPQNQPKNMTKQSIFLGHRVTSTSPRPPPSSGPFDVRKAGSTDERSDSGAAGAPDCKTLFWPVPYVMVPLYRGSHKVSRDLWWF